MNKIIKISVLILFVSVSLITSAQQSKIFTPLTADSLKSGNYKDVLSSFFQLAVDNISQNKEFVFTSNPFAVMAKMNPELMIDTNYYKYRRLRNLNFTFGYKVNSDFKFNGFSSSINYALINKRDITVSRDFITSAFNANDEFNKLNDRFEQYIATIPPGDERKKIRAIKTSIFLDTSALIKFNQLPKETQQLILNLADSVKAIHFLSLVKANPSINIWKASQQSYDSIKNNFLKKPLWTLGLSDTTDQNQFFFSKVVASTRFLQGVFNPTKPCTIELDIRSSVIFVRDTLKSGNNLKRRIFNLDPGINLVFKSRNTLRSWFELKLSSTYRHILSGLYLSEKKSNFTLNGTLRIRMIQDFWLPLTIKYDPKKGNFFGFLTVKFNFTGQGNSNKK